MAYGDNISRQTVLDIAFKYCPDDDGVCSEAGSDLRNMLDEFENLPPAQPQIIRCRDCMNYKDHRCTVANHHVSEKESCAEVFGAKRRTE